MEKLTKELATKEFEKIKSVMSDDEAAHSYEDNLNGWFIGCLKDNMYDTIDEITEVANIVAQTSDLDFARWCA